MSMTLAERRREKLKNAVLYFVQQDKTVGLTKLMKLLFFLDFRLYAKYGESLTGQTYSAWRYGPVPADVWRELHEKQDCQLHLASVVKVIPVQPDPRDEAVGIKLKPIPKAKFSDFYFTGRELQELHAVSEMFRNLPAKLLVDSTHDRNTPWDVTIKTLGEGQPIDYELALADCDEEKKAYIHEVRDDAAMLEALFA